MLNKLGRITRLNPDRVQPDAPPGQFVTDRFPVLTFGPTPRINLDDWQFKISGLVDEEITLDWKQFNDLPQITLDAEFHCVTQWSKLQNTWQGILFTDVMKLVTPKPGYGGYSTNVALDVLVDDDVMFAHSHDGAPLTPEHGGPMRLVVPKRYGWKSAKWVNGIEFMAEDEPGFWEMRGYHMEGDPWKEERFWSSLTY
ncbi:MAG: sulfite oxidase-like oxidoreductase [Dehalococcoidia bacterium]|nr:sulfite oxidase-like oxidoreductase [Dehalococcoidia bacterium]